VVGGKIISTVDGSTEKVTTIFYLVYPKLLSLGRTFFSRRDKGTIRFVLATLFVECQEYSLIYPYSFLIASLGYLTSTSRSLVFMFDMMTGDIIIESILISLSSTFFFRDLV